MSGPALNTKSSAIRAVIKGLQGFLLTEMPTLQAVMDNWPSPNQQIKYPAISILAKTPKFSPVSPYVITVGTPDPVTHLAPTKRVIGEWDFSFQVDLWTGYKPQRDSMTEEIVAAFSKNRDFHGVDLVLSDYHSINCHYAIQSVDYVEDQEGPDRNEWRSVMTVVASVYAISDELAYLMETIENNLETPQEIVL